MTHPGAPANSLILATLDHLSRFAPFDRMEREHLVWLASRLEIGYYAKGEVVLSPEQGEAHKFFVIKQGVVQGEQGVVRAQEDAAWLELHEGECFPLGALLSKRPVTSLYRAQEDVFCYELSAADFMALTHKSEAFHDFCTRRIANLLEQSKHIIQAQYSQSSAEQQSMSSPLSAITRREPVACAPETPLREVLESMQRLGIGSMIAVDANHKPVGIFTLHDVLARVTLPGLSLDTPLAQVMSPDPFTLSPHALVHEAALAMAKHGFRHILVTENSRLKGLVSEKDLFSLQRVGLRQVGSAIRNAERLECLQQSALDIRELAHNMLAQGVAAEQLTQIISTLNDLLTARIVEIELGKARSMPGWVEVDFCWLALGSEGRYEQTLSTDQDNGIVFNTPAGTTPERVRTQFLPFARAVNETLDACGFPLCKGEVMASNPKWCLSLEEWQNIFSGWLFRADRPELLNASIFFDFRSLFGNCELVRQLREWLNDKIKDNRLFLKKMVENALGNRPPLGVLRDFLVERRGENTHTLDLKINGVTPFVDAARIFALAVGSSESGSIQRLRAAGEAWQIDKVEVDAWIEAFLFIQLLRLRLQHEQAERHQALSNRVNPDSLNTLDRRILKEAFRQARKLQGLLEKYFTF